MSSVFDTLQEAIELFVVDVEAKRLICWTLDGLHDNSHKHEDWLNRDNATRIAAGNLFSYIEKGRGIGGQ